MDFTHTETRRMLADTIDRYLRDKYPLAERVLAGNSETGFSKTHWDGLAELGVIAALFTEDQGGFGGEGFDISVVFEELGKKLVVEPLLDNALIPGTIFANAGRMDAVENIIAGSARYALAAEEAAARYDLAYVATTATAKGDGWVLNGHKTVVKFAQGTDGIIVSARTDGDVYGAEGISLFLIPLDADGVEIMDYSTVDGGNASEITLRNVAVSSDALVGEKGKGSDLLVEASDRAILALCAEAIGIMQRARDLTVEYLQTRKQFGVPIGKFQALQHRMAEMLLEIEQATSAVINAASSLGNNDISRKRTLAAAKYSIGRIGRLVAEDSIQMHGGIGMTWEYDLGHFSKRLIMIDHEFGDEDFHLAKFIQLGAA